MEKLKAMFYRTISLISIPMYGVIIVFFIPINLFTYIIAGFSSVTWAMDKCELWDEFILEKIEKCSG